MKKLIVAMCLGVACLWGAIAYAGHCTPQQIDGDTCYSGGADDSRGPYYGCTVEDPNICDAWHGYGDRDALLDAQAIQANTVRDNADGDNCVFLPNNSDGVGAEVCCDRGSVTCCTPTDSRNPKVCRRNFNLYWVAFHLSCAYDQATGTTLHCDIYVN